MPTCINFQLLSLNSVSEFLSSFHELVFGVHHCQLVLVIIFSRNGFYEADSESEDGDFAAQIREQTSRIQKEIELERKLKTRQVDRLAKQTAPAPQFNESDDAGYSTLPRYKGSGSYNNIPSAQDAHAFQAYSASTPDMSSLYAAQQVGYFF